MNPDRNETIIAQLDGSLFRAQRELLLKLAAAAKKNDTIQLSDQDHELIEGLITLTDVIADEAHDRHGIACLLTQRSQP